MAPDPAGGRRPGSARREGGALDGSRWTRLSGWRLAALSSLLAADDTVDLGGLTFSLAVVDDVTDGPNGLPNGGPTATHALFPGSPAIDAGGNPAALASDRRGAGFVRTSGAATDVGAFEVQLDADLSVTKTDGVTQVDAGGSLTYTIVASNAGPFGALLMAALVAAAGLAVRPR